MLGSPMDWMFQTRKLPGLVAFFVVFMGLLPLAPDARAQTTATTDATVQIPEGTTVTLVVNGVPQSFSSGDSVDLSQTIAVPATATVTFALSNGATVEPAGGSIFTVAATSNNTTVTLNEGTASVATTVTTDTVAISNANGMAISGTDVTSSYDASTQESSVEVNSGTATLSGSASNGTKTVDTDNITLNATDTNQKVFNVSFDDGGGVGDTDSGFQTTSSAPNQSPNPVGPVVPAATALDVLNTLIGDGGVGLGVPIATQQIDSASP